MQIIMAVALDICKNIPRKFNSRGKLKLINLLIFTLAKYFQGHMMHLLIFKKYGSGDRHLKNITKEIQC